MSEEVKVTRAVSVPAGLVDTPEKRAALEALVTRRLGEALIEECRRQAVQWMGGGG